MELNFIYVQATNEPHEVRDLHLLHSAVAVPQHCFYYEQQADLAYLGLRLAVAIARNHPFTQGNKRTGWGAMLMFWELNGYELVNEDHAYYAELLIAVITREIELENMLVQLNLQPITRFEIEEPGF